MIQSKGRTLLVGIDAACWEYLDPLLSRGRLPTIERLIEVGVHGTLDSTVPPLTPVAWSSIATGKGPAKHGVYEWVRREENGYKFLPTSLGRCIGTPFWSRLDEHDLKVGLVNVPLTYHPPRINGFVVCGFGTPESAQEPVYPAEFRDEIERLLGPYQPSDPKEPRSSSEAAALFDAERCWQEQQVRIAITGAERYGADVLVINLMFLDHANHYLSDMRLVEDAIVHTDLHLGLLLKGFQPDTVLLISDHGSRRIHGRFLLGSWLSDRGYQVLSNHRQVRRDYMNWLLLQLLQRPLGSLSMLEKLVRRLVVEVWLRAPSRVEHLLWKVLHRQMPLQRRYYWCSPTTLPRASQVYAGSSWGCLYLNVVGREPAGLIPPERQEEVLTRLMAELAHIVDPDTGEPLFSQIYTREDLYSSSAPGEPPDVVLDYYSTRWGLTRRLPPPVVPRHGYFARGADGWYGDHSHQGMFVFAGRGIVSNPNRGAANLIDVPATLLYLHDVPIPDDYDGRVLVELLEPALLSAQRVRVQPGDSAKVSDGESEYSEVEAAELLDRLQALGYVE